MPLVDEHVWIEEVKLDCADADTRGGPNGIGTYRVLTITERAYYAVETSAPIGLIGRCADEDLPLPTELGDPAYGDLPPVTSAFPEQYTRTLLPDEATVLDLVPGRYELSLAFPDHETHTAQFEVRAASGPVPSP